MRVAEYDVEKTRRGKTYLLDWTKKKKPLMEQSGMMVFTNFQ